jgi:hypothetical protein
MPMSWPPPGPRCPARNLLVAVSALLAAGSLAAQDLLGVTWTGAVVRVDSYTGAVTALGPGLQGQNSLARAANGTFWSTRRISSTQYSFTNVDPSTGTATPVFSGVDVRGLATGPGNTLYGIKDAPGADLLVTIDTAASGFVIQVGSTGFDSIQGLASHQGMLYAWDTTAGLLVVDPLSGAAVDPFPAVGGPVFQQSLCSHPDGRLLLGGGDSIGTDSLFAVDVTNGGTTLIGTMNGAVDVRGLEPLAGSTVAFGQGCLGVYGPVALSLTGSSQVGGTLTATSTNHAPNAIGVMMFGASTTVYQGLSLPLLLDPLLGTSNCRLYASIDGSVVSITGPATPAVLQFSFVVPVGTSGARLHLQHTCLEAVPGFLSWSNAITVQVP